MEARLQGPEISEPREEKYAGDEYPENRLGCRTQGPSDSNTVADGGHAEPIVIVGMGMSTPCQ